MRLHERVGTVHRSRKVEVTAVGKGRAAACSEEGEKKGAGKDGGRGEHCQNIPESPFLLSKKLPRRSASARIPHNDFFPENDARRLCP